MNEILLDIPEQFETDHLILRAPKFGDGAMVNTAIRESIQFLSEWMLWADHVPEIDETEAVNGLTTFAFNCLRANRVEIHCDTEITASRGVAERCGYHLEAIFINNFINQSEALRDDCIYAKVRLQDGTFGYPHVISQMG